MTPELAISIPHAAAALLPVCLFLGALVFLDSYKLVRPRWVGYALLAGTVAAALSYVVQTNAIGDWGISFRAVSLYVAPVLEEVAKASFLIWLIMRHRVGFQVDAAILGFAIGTGFALAENVYYLSTHTGTGLFSWILRGLGTAVMHGGTTCLFGIISKTLYDRASNIAGFLPGLAVACVVHAAFNHFLLPPLATTAIIVGVFPLLVIVVFTQSERATRRWLGTGFDTDQAVMEALTFGNIGEDPIGRYLQELRAHFPGEIVADMLCLLRLRAELAVKAKGLLMMREAGFNVEAGPEVHATFDEIDYLKKSIGPTGLLALAPFLSTSARENWQVHLLKTN